MKTTQKTNLKNAMILTSVLFSSLMLSACGSISATITGSIAGISSLAEDVSTDAAAFAAAGNPSNLQPATHHDQEASFDRAGFSLLGLLGPVQSQQLTQLNLTADQQLQLAALEAETRSFIEANRPDAQQTEANNRETLKTAFYQAFQSDNFDADALSANRPARLVPSDTVIAFQADQLIKAHALLTAEQRALLFTEPEFSQHPLAVVTDAEARQSERLAALSTQLSLTTEQQTQLAAIFSAESAHYQSAQAAYQAEQQAKRQALKTILSADTVDRAALITQLKSQTNQTPQIDSKLAQLEQIHTLLTPKQRSKWLEMMSAGRPQGSQQTQGFDRTPMTPTAEMVIR